MKLHIEDITIAKGDNGFWHVTSGRMNAIFNGVDWTGDTAFFQCNNITYCSVWFSDADAARKMIDGFMGVEE